MSSGKDTADKDLIHLLIKKTSASCGDTKLSQQLSSTSANLPFGPHGNVKRLEELVLLFYEGYAPYTPSLPECRCAQGGACVLQIMKAFLSVGGKEYLENSLRDADDDHVEWVMKLSWRYHVCRNVIAKCKGELYEAPIFSGMGSDLDKMKGAKKGAKKEFKVVAKEIDWEHVYVPALRKRAAMGEKAVSTMFEILIGDIRMPRKVKADIYMAPITEFQIIPTLFSTFENLTGAAAKLALENLNVSLMNSKTNLEIVFRQPLWQKWFIPFLLTKDSKVIVEKRNNTLSPELETAIFKFAVNLITMIHYHCFKTKNKGFRSLWKDTRALLIEKSGWTEETAAITRVLLFTFIKRVQTDAQAYQTDYTVPVWENLFKLFDSIEQFMFYEPIEKDVKKDAKKEKDSKKRIGLHLEEDGSCQDLILVIDIIELLESKFDLNFFNPKFNNVVANNPKLTELGSHLHREKEFFRNVRQFFLSLENASSHDMVVKNLSALLQSRSTGKFDSIFSKVGGKASALEKQLAVAVQEQKVMVSSTKDATVQVSSASEAEILKNAKRGFKNASAAQRFCIEKRQAALLDNNAFSSPISITKKVIDNGKGTVRAKKNKEKETDQKQDTNISVIKEESVATASEDLKNLKLDVGASSEGNELEKSPLNSQTTLTSSETVEMEDISYAPPEKPVATKWAISNYDFDAEESNELSICSGQVVEVLQEKSNGWWLVSYDDKIGFAPSNYLEVINEEEALALIKEGAPKPANKDESKESKTAEDTKDSAKEMKKAREDEGYDEEVDEVFADFEMEHVTEQLISITSGDQKAEEKDVDPLAATLSSTVSLGAKLHCGYCNIELSPLDFYELDGVICCKDDLLKNFLKCFVCENHISGEHIVLAAGRLHLSCASCTVCNKTFSDPCEIQHKGSKLYCKSHYDELFGFECAHCNKIIEGQYLMALGKYWHLDHFRCFGACGKPLDGEYVVHEGKQYCMEDYKKSHAKKCALCNESIVTSALNAGELYYHSTCVKCDVCKHAYELGSNFFPEPLDGKSHHKFLCSTHYASKYLKPCSKCDLTIAAGEDRAFGDGRWWHPSCLKCDMCGKVVFNEQFFFSDKQILCMADYEKTHLEKCGICGKAITAKYASLLDMKVHIECVKCAVCDQLLVGTNLGVRQSKTTGKILCSEHFLAESAKKCHGCGNYIVKGGMLSVKDKTYHSECLVCEICKTNLKGKPFAVINDKLRCAEHAKSTAK